MSNPLFDALGSGQYGNLTGMLQQFNQFRQTFRGDPKQQVQQLLNSGQISQAQYNQAVQMAKALQNMLNMK